MIFQAMLGVNGGHPSTVSVASVAFDSSFNVIPTYFSSPSLGPTVESGVLTLNPQPTRLGFVPLPGNNFANGQQFTVRACGDILLGTSNTSPSVKLLLATTKNMNVVSANVSDLHTIVSTTQTTNGEFPSPFVLTATMQGTTKSGIVQGTYSIQFDNTAPITGQISALSGVDFSSGTPLAFAVGVSFSVNATPASPNIANLYEFSLYG